MTTLGGLARKLREVVRGGDIVAKGLPVSSPVKDAQRVSAAEGRKTTSCGCDICQM